MTTPATRPSLWVSHPTGNANVRAALDAFEGAGMLEAFHTCLGVGNDADGTLAARLFGQRNCPIPTRKLVTQPSREFLRLLFQRRGWFPRLRRHETGPLCIDRIYRSLDTSVARRLRAAAHRPSAIYAYEDGAAASFQAARDLGVRCVYDLPIGYWRAARRIQLEESQLHPAWAGTMPALIDSESKLQRKDEELQLADQIIVASRFTADTLQEAPYPLPRISVIPYGCPIAATMSGSVSTSSKPLKVLYVGSLSQRKGLAYLLDAVHELGGSVELTLVGKRVADCEPLDRALETYRWIDALPHVEILRLMREQDVLVFPSLFEGFGLVLTEALSQGMTIISTPHTCAPDIIEDGKEGFIVPIRDAVAIAEKLTVLHRDRERLHAMKSAALVAAQNTTWRNYARALLAAVQPESALAP